MTCLFPLQYPDSPVYSAGQFDAVARAYVHDGLSCAGAGRTAAMDAKTAARFLRRNGLHRDDGIGGGLRRYYADLRRQRAERVASLSRRRYPRREIARALDCSPRTVSRCLAHARSLGLL